jgi:hypothetical protein
VIQHAELCGVAKSKNKNVQRKARRKIAQRRARVCLRLYYKNRGKPRDKIGALRIFAQNFSRFLLRRTAECGTL